MPNPYRGTSETRISSGEGSSTRKRGSMPRPPDAHPNPTTTPLGPPAGGGTGVDPAPRRVPSDTGIGGMRFPNLGPDGEERTIPAADPRNKPHQRDRR